MEQIRQNAKRVRSLTKVSNLHYYFYSCFPLPGFHHPRKEIPTKALLPRYRHTDYQPSNTEYEPDQSAPTILCGYGTL